ncbi:MAG TPA: FMN-dependent NADH-azoreductase [Steroidobacteraceae bacterium]|jgi:FMN-dependent NADH-azoreductase|nr:FMN-dependent NADH-azoreductase [Steroidobacteraceae bacterium]
MKVLHVDASILGESSVSRQLSAAIVERLRAAHPEIAVTYYDLGAEPIGHLTGAHLAAARGAFAQSASLQQDVARGQDALEDFLSADIVVVGAPMYNFSVSSQLKAWIDRLAVAGKTFRYGPNGVQGLAGGKKVIVASSRGGFYGPDTATAFLDHQETYLRGIFGFFGITDITFVRAEGLNVSAEQRKAAIAAATAAAASLAA